MKKIFLIILLSTLILTWCSSANKENVTSLQKVEKTYFDVSIPAKWTLIENDSKSLPTPKSGEIALAALSTETNWWFANNLLILSQDVYKPIKSNDFSIVNNVWSTKDYVNYQKLDTKTIEFADKDTSTLYIFEAKYNLTTPILKYLQVWKVCSQKKAYLLTIAVSQDVKNTSDYEDILKSFTCK